MAAVEFDILLRYLRALADENRLKIISLVSSRAYQVGELAEILNLTEPTVSPCRPHSSASAGIGPAKFQ